LGRGHAMRWAALASPGYLVTASVLKLMLTLTRRGAGRSRVVLWTGLDRAEQGKQGRLIRREGGGGEDV
jgi:hypothetical protein